MNRKPNRVSRCAMTLIEMIVAVTLSVVLLVVLMAVTRQTLGIRNRSMLVASRLESYELLSDQFRRDFGHATQIALVGDGVLLQGNLFRDETALTATHRSAIVRYRVVAPSSSGDRSWLIRSQCHADLDGSPRSAFTSEAVHVDITSIRVTSDWMEAFSETENVDVFADDILNSPKQTMPSTMRIELFGRDGRLAFQQTVHHHWEE